MNRLLLSVALCALVAALAACGPSIVVQNRTQIPVRVIVTSNGARQVLSPSPGESSTAELEQGPFQATAIADAEWIDYAKGVRKYLNEQLANSDNLTGPQLLEVIRKLKDIAARMAQFEQAARADARCSGKITEESSSAFATVTTLPTGALSITCK